MRRFWRSRWWGLFALMPLTVALILLDGDAPLPETWRLVLLTATAVVICVLALAWVERHHELMEREGVDALVGYRSLPGTIDALGSDLTTREPLKAGHRRFVSGYDPMVQPPAAHGGPDDLAGELAS